MEQDITKVIVFQLVNEEYVFPIENVRSIEKLQPITRVPHTLEFVKGVINLRGVIIPILDLRKLFGMTEAAYTDQTRIIIITHDDYEVGLIVDSANDVLDIPNDSIEQQPEIVGTLKVEYINGVVKVDDRLLIMLTLEHILQLNHMKEIAIG
ncbi:chemotaxis protein CheW [Litchfieldia alkalitelluris]|uniref:chemotaxis protein CheW n=1 Tax=Litchfieldia alkalitelluris TaxID=304268 RepID=UPI000995F00E|nr:chemotaxis protein CheW [Litchfieldia alkalitelluris]